MVKSAVEVGCHSKEETVSMDVVKALAQRALSSCEHTDQRVDLCCTITTLVTGSIVGVLTMSSLKFSVELPLKNVQSPHLLLVNFRSMDLCA